MDKIDGCDGGGVHERGMKTTLSSGAKPKQRGLAAYLQLEARPAVRRNLLVELLAAFLQTPAKLEHNSRHPHTPTPESRATDISHPQSA